MFRFKQVAFCKSKSFYYTVLKYFLYTVIKPLTQFVTNFVIHRWYPFSQHLNSLKKCCEKGYHRCMFRCTFQLGTSKDGNNFESFEARKNFKGKGRKTFDLKEFRRAPIRIVYDSLHGISTVGIHGLIVFSKVIVLFSE